MAIPTIETLASEIADLKRRIGIMESAPQLGYSSVSEGALQIANGVGTVQIRLGETAVGSGKFGLVVGVDEAVPAMELNDVDGMTYPQIPVPFPDPNLVHSVAAGTVTLRFAGRMAQVSHKGLAVATRITVPAATTGTVRLVSTWPSGSASSNTRALVGPGINFNTFYWLHGVPIGQITGTQTAVFQIQVALTGGAGPIDCAPPDWAFLMGPAHCSAAGTYVP
jgi:hypothetical protein